MRAYRKIDDHFEVKIEKGRLVVLGVGAGLTFLLVFLVGVLVGKGLWGGRQDLSAATPAVGPAQETEKPRYTFYDDLKRPDPATPKAMEPVPVPPEAVGETAVPATKPVGEVSPMEAHGELAPQGRAKVSEKPTEAVKRPETVVPGRDGKMAEAEKIAKTSKSLPSPKSAENAKGQTPPKPAVETKTAALNYTVQVGSFRDRASAEDQVKKIGAQGVSAQVVPAPMEGRTWYRVQVGRYGTRAEAESYYQKKMRPKGIQGFVTQK